MEKLTAFELDYLINEARKNRENSAALAEVPGQRWAKAHEAEVKTMDSLITKLEAMKEQPECTGLVIQYFMSGYYLCDGKPPEGCENDGEIYVGNTVKWFETWDEANEMRDMINAAYGRSSDKRESDSCAG